MSPSTLALTVLGTVATSAGIVITVVNLTNADNESIEEKIEKLWEEIKNDVMLLTAQISKITQNKDSDISKRCIDILKEISKIATNKNNDNNYILNPYENPQETYTKLEQIQKELSEVLELLEKFKKITI